MNDYFLHFVVRVFSVFGVGENDAMIIYQTFVEQNANLLIFVGYLTLFCVFFYIALAQMTNYLNQVENGIDNIVSDSMEPVQLFPELAPIEERLNKIKMNLKQQELEAQESERRKNELVVFLAHDLKTPLTSILAYLTILETRPQMSEEERAKYTNISLQKAVRLGELINEFFEITKFNLQDINLEKHPLDIAMMLEQIADELYGVLREKALECKVDIEETLVVEGDADKLARVFDNILRNAVAYCYAHTEIEIHASYEGDQVKIVFVNQGKTIPEEKLYTIFEKFYRIDDSRSSITGGAGLGLAISKEIIELHGGNIYAESEEEQTRFIVLLPRIK